MNSADVMRANRQSDADYNDLTGRGVKVTNKDRQNARSKKPNAVPATADDIKAEAEVRDIDGVVLGKIATLGENETVADPEAPVIDTGNGKIAVPLMAFGKDKKGLMLSITAEKFNELVSQASAPEASTE